MIALVTGGASCGKSAFAERLCLQLGDVRVYLAAMKPYGEEGAARVRKHRAQRAGKGFRTVECFDGLDAAMRDGGLEGATVLLECLGNVVANELFRDGRDATVPGAAKSTEEAVLRDFGNLAACCEHVVVVGNEVGADGVRYGCETQAYQEALGAVACGVAARSDLVVECAAGVPLVVKRDGELCAGANVRGLFGPLAAEAASR